MQIRYLVVTIHNTGLVAEATIHVALAPSDAANLMDTIGVTCILLVGTTNAIDTVLLMVVVPIRMGDRKFNTAL